MSEVQWIMNYTMRLMHTTRLQRKGSSGVPTPSPVALATMNCVWYHAEDRRHQTGDNKQLKHHTHAA